MFEEDEDQLAKPVLAEQDISDEMQINLAISEFYQVCNSLNNDNGDEVMQKLKARRNVLINMMQVYLAKFNNQPIINDFIDALVKARKDAIRDGKLHKYPQYLNEIRTVGTFLGIRENISDKLAEELLDAMRESEETQDPVDSMIDKKGDE